MSSARLQPGELDLLCLPEMILTGLCLENNASFSLKFIVGYAFPSAESIKPYLEKPRIGPTSRFCSDLAKRLCCHVIAGYPETMSCEEKLKAEGSVGYNSAIIYGPDGEWRGDYRKTNLFQTDVTWARKGIITLP